MGKNIYKIIIFTIVIIMVSSVILKRDIDRNLETINESEIETISNTDKNEPSKKEVKKQARYSTWDLNSLYKSKKDWELDLKKLDKETKELKNYIGKITKSSKHLRYALKIKEGIDIKLEKLYAFISLNEDINKKSYDFMDLEKKLNKSYKKYNTICSELELEILKLSNKEYKSIIGDNRISSKYKIYLNDIRKNKEHYLKPEEERILSEVSDISSLPSDIYELFTNMDKKSSLNPDEYALAIENENRDIRKKAFENEAVLYNDNLNTLSGLLIGQVKKNIFYSKIRGYEDSRNMYMSSDNIDSKVYDELISTVNKNLETLHKYISLRKFVLNTEEIYSYDMYNSIIPPVEEYISYDKAQGIIYSALNPLGKEYGDILYKSFNERWIDVYSNENKVGGAYCLSLYDNHPYVLTNYSGNLDSVSTLAHELGHALYGYMSAKNQNYLNSKPSVFTHEVASITNEVLLYEMLIKNAKNNDEKAYYISQYLDLIKDTLFTQTMYAEFEQIIHRKMENGEVVNVLVLNDIWGELLSKYYGKDFKVDQLSKIGWAKIPHFYSSFYVYKYATGCSAAVAFSEDIINDGPENYISFLKKGGSNYPIELLKESGVNLYSTKPIEKTVKKFNDLVSELEKLLKN